MESPEYYKQLADAEANQPTDNPWMLMDVFQSTVFIVYKVSNGKTQGVFPERRFADAFLTTLKRHKRGMYGIEEAPFYAFKPKAEGSSETHSGN